MEELYVDDWLGSKLAGFNAVTLAGKFNVSFIVSVAVGCPASVGICNALVEFELKQGSAQDLIDFTKTWVDKYQLWLDVRSKAERGNLLAVGKRVSPATKAKQLNLESELSAELSLA